MSLSKVQSFVDNYRRDSFSDQFCDDLSEIILQFLPFEDKFRLECVSKQFQRTVFAKQNELIIDKILVFRSTLRNAMNCRKYNERSLSILINILEKLPKIRCLRQKTFHEILLNDRDLDLIIKYCRHLTAIHCDFKQISDIRILTERTKILSLWANVNTIQSLKYPISQPLPHIQELNCLRNYYSCPLTFPLISELKIKNLKKLSIDMNDNIIDNLEVFQQFIDNNKSLTHLTLDLDIREENVSIFLFKQISRLDNLIELKVKSRYRVADIWLTDGLKQIALNCTKLMSLSLSWLFIQEITETKIIFSNFAKFKHLKQLSVEMFGITSEGLKGIEIVLNDSMKSLKDLTKLKIKFPKMFKIEEKLFKEFDKILPKLKNLFISDSIELSEETVDVLSRLSRLESLELTVTDLSIAAIIETKILSKCPKIKSLKIGI